MCNIKQKALTSHNKFITKWDKSYTCVWCVLLSAVLKDARQSGENERLQIMGESSVTQALYTTEYRHSVH